MKRFLPATLLMTLIAAPAWAQPEKKDATPKKAEPKRVKFEFRDKRWSEVLEWLSDQTGLPIVGSSKPAGTFSFVPNAGMTYTTEEIIGILNDALVPTHYKLVRRPNSIAVMPVDERAVASKPIVDVLPSRLDVVRTAETLRGMFGRAPDLYLEADAARGAIIVRGTPEQIVEIKAALVVLEQDLPGVGNVRVITLERGGAVALAEEIARVLRAVRPNVPVRVVEPSKTGEEPKLPAKGDKGLTLMAGGNRLIIASDDQQALALAGELGRLYTAEGEGDYLVVALRSADAATVAKVLDETFNGPRTANRRNERLRVVADPASNSLLIKGGPIDLLVVRRLLQEHLDMPEHDAQVEVRTFLIGPLKNARAEEMANLLKEVYRNDKGSRGFTATADKRTNTIVLRCAAPLHEDAKRLVDQLDTPVDTK
jgi:type II secretory pathway component GspD/PulD (secretin)